MTMVPFRLWAPCVISALDPMSGITNSKMLSRLGRRRRIIAFLTVATTTFFVLSLIWPLSIKAWRSESNISLTLTERQDAPVEFKKLLEEVVNRHTAPQAIAASLQQHGLRVPTESISSDEIAEKIKQRLEVVLINGHINPDQLTVRVGLNGEATEQDNYFVNVLATTIARDFMTSPLAGILPTEPLPAQDIESLQERHTEIEQRANELLSQIKSNMHQSANELAQSVMSEESEDMGTLSLDGETEEPGGLLELADADSSGNDMGGDKRLFHMASHPSGSSVTSSSLTTLLDSLHSTISDLANVGAEACSAVQSASRTRPAFSVLGVESRPAVPVNAIPKNREIFLLLLGSGLFAAFVSMAYKPFAELGFESVEQVGRKLDLPVIATLETEKRFDDVTGPGLPVESTRTETPGSNQIVNACKWILFCSLMLTIGFCLVNADIRNAFFVGPFHGFAQIVWTLQGN